MGREEKFGRGQLWPSDSEITTEDWLLVKAILRATDCQEIAFLYIYLHKSLQQQMHFVA